MPILKILYHAPEKNSHHIYMALIVLLILSEDEVFDKAVHEIVSIICKRFGWKSAFLIISAHDDSLFLVPN